MFHRAIKLRYLPATKLAVTFQDGLVKSYDMKVLFGKYPQLKALQDRTLFLSGKLDPGGYGIIWNDDLDIEVETIYENGTLTGKRSIAIHDSSARAVAYARALAGVSQKRLSEETGIDQSDISRIERGIANPSVSTLERIAKALGGQLHISIAMPGDEDFNETFA